MSEYYILGGEDGRTPIQATMEEWSAWEMDARKTQASFDRMKRVWLTNIGGYRISTVFLGLNHGWMSEHPLIFETLADGPEGWEEMERYSTWEEAELGHFQIVEEIVRRFF